MSETETIGSIVDQLVTLEIRPQGLLEPGLISELHDAAREAEGGPVSATVARSLISNIDEDDTVLLTTGAGSPPWLPKGENDGPPGVIGLARAIALALNAHPVLITEERCLDPLVKGTRACGLDVVTYDQLKERNNAVAVESFPETIDEAKETAEDFIDTYDPSAVIAVEKIGPNEEAVIHSITGHDHTKNHARVEELFDRADEHDILTVGVGDGGNEIGFGKIEDEIRRIQPYGDVCQCDCQGGVATRVATDHLVVGGTSNWGAYGVQAMIAILTETPEALHRPADEIRMLEELMVEGAVDGLHARPLLGVDGTAGPTTEGIVAILNDIVDKRLTEVDRSF